MSAVIYTGDLAAEALAELVATLRPQSPHTIVERVDDFDFPAPDAPVVPAEWDEGRIFGPGLELHWVRRPPAFQVVLTREDGGDNAGLHLNTELFDFERRERAYYLWGEEDIRIGRELTYRSIAGKGRAQLSVAEFYDAAGELRHWRYVRFLREVQHV